MMNRNKMMAQLGQTIHAEWKKEIRVNWELSRCIPRKNRVKSLRNCTQNYQRRKLRSLKLGHLGKGKSTVKPRHRVGVPNSIIYLNWTSIFE